MPRGVRADAINQWIITVSNNCDRIKQITTMTERLNYLKKLAKNIKGVGNETIEKTLLEFEVFHY
ncbi:MAG: hypothetical protein IKD41_02295 [Alistipes sp.]|nr:hypothetical protein [Alistipes sp.]